MLVRQVLSDPEKRKIYDQYGEEALQNGVSPECVPSLQQEKRRGGLLRTCFTRGIHTGGWEIIAAAF